MNDNLLERIQSVGRWRFNVRPLVPLEQPLSFQQCSDLVRDRSVSIRGWDFPHIASRQDDCGGWLRDENFYENWCDWWMYREFWRMYKSGQFLSYNALREDTSDENGDMQRGTLDILNTIYSVTEFVEFAHRLQLSGPYRDGVSIMIALRNTQGRSLEVGRGRMPFFERKQTGAEIINLECTLEESQIGDQHQNVAVDLILELFDYFGWNPPRDQIASDQAKFYRRDFG